MLAYPAIWRTLTMFCMEPRHMLTCTPVEVEEPLPVRFFYHIIYDNHVASTQGLSSSAPRETKERASRPIDSTERPPFQRQYQSRRSIQSWGNLVAAI